MYSRCNHCDQGIEFPDEMLGLNIACPNCYSETTLINSQRLGKSFSIDSGPLKTELSSDTNLDAELNTEKKQPPSENDNVAKFIQIIGFIFLITTCVEFAFSGKASQIFTFSFRENQTLNNAIYQENIKINICILLAFGCTGAIAALKTFLENRFKLFIPIIFLITLVVSNTGNFAKYDQAQYVVDTFEDKYNVFPVYKGYEKYFDKNPPTFKLKEGETKSEDMKSLYKAAGIPESNLMTFNIGYGFWIILMGIILEGKFSGKSLFYKNFGWVFAIFTYLLMAIDHFATGDIVSSVVVIQLFTFLKVLTGIASMLPYKHKIKFA